MFTQIYRIIKDGIKSLLYDIDGHRKSIIKIILFFVIVPLFVSLYIVKFIDLSTIFDALLTCLSIFTALIFSVLFTVPDKLNQRIKDLQDKKDNATRGYLIRFYNFSKSFVQQISFVVILCFVLIILLIIQKIHCYIIITFIGIFLFSVLFMYLLSILSNIYILLMDDIERNGADI